MMVRQKSSKQLTQLTTRKERVDSKQANRWNKTHSLVQQPRRWTGTFYITLKQQLHHYRVNYTMQWRCRRNFSEPWYGDKHIYINIDACACVHVCEHSAEHIYACDWKSVKNIYVIMYSMANWNILLWLASTLVIGINRVWTRIA